MQLAVEGKINCKLVNNEVVEQQDMMLNNKAQLLTDWRDMCDVNLGQSPSFNLVNTEWPQNTIVKGLKNDGIMLN